MSNYYKRVPFFIRWIYSRALWEIKTTEKIIYLTFDDGPTPDVTDFVLSELNKYGAKATFFCLGQNVINLPLLRNKIRENGHEVGNHSYSHLNGFRTKTTDYINDISRAESVIESRLFRPPYGKMKLRQYKRVSRQYKIVMWDVMSGDFDNSLDGKQCYENVINNAKEGSIVVLHDSEQAFPRLKIALPKILKYYHELGYKFESINIKNI